LRAAAQDRVMRPVVYRGRAVLGMRHGDLRRGGADVTRSVSHLERDVVDAPVAVAFPLGAQLHRFAVGRDYDVVSRAAVSAAVVRLVTGHAGYPRAADAYAGITIIADARNQIAYLEGRVLVIRRPQRISLTRRNDGLLRVV